MYFNSSHGKIYYEVVGSGETLILLHGWGQSTKTFDNLVDCFKSKYQVITLDFLGFGKSDLPLETLCLDDYVVILEELIDYLACQEITFIAHSFGGRVAIKYSSRNENVKRLFLVDSAGIKPKRHIKYYYLVYSYKIRKFYYKIFNHKKLETLIKNSGSEDYQNLVDVMKGTFIKIVNEDLKNHLKKVKVPTVLIWGLNDKETPLKDGKAMHKLLKKSELIIFYNSGHYPYITEEKKFIRVINQYIEGVSSGLY